MTYTPGENGEAVLAEGVGAESFSGYYDNTQIYEKMADLLNIA